MVARTRTCSPSRTEGSGSVAFASFNIRSGRNGGLEAALRAMKQLGVDIGFLMETKLTGGIYTLDTHRGTMTLPRPRRRRAQGGLPSSGGAIFRTRSRRQGFGGPMLFLCI